MKNKLLSRQQNNPENQLVSDISSKGKINYDAIKQLNQSIARQKDQSTLVDQYIDR